MSQNGSWPWGGQPQPYVGLYSVMDMPMGDVPWETMRVLVDSADSNKRLPKGCTVVVLSGKMIHKIVVVPKGVGQVSPHEENPMSASS